MVRKALEVVFKEDKLSITRKKTFGTGFRVEDFYKLDIIQQSSLSHVTYVSSYNIFLARMCHVHKAVLLRMVCYSTVIRLNVSLSVTDHSINESFVFRKIPRTAIPKMAMTRT